MSQLRVSFLLPLLAFTVIAVVGAVALYSTLSGSRDPAQLPSVLVGKQAPQTTLPGLRQPDPGTGTRVTLAKFRGQPLLVNFFASWCAPCRAEAPALEMLSKDIAIFGIAYKDRSEDTSEFLQQFGNPFQAIGMDNDGRTGIAWGVYGVPETYLLDADGVILLRHAGPLTRGIINSTIMPALKALRS
jgi:cytochrome c biogenesis protein CcmG/thiol:disulfide interchange protein DsbE